MANTVRKKKKVSVKEMKFKHDPMVRFYDRTQEWLQERGRPVVIAVGVIIGVILLYVAGSYFLEYRKTKAQTWTSEENGRKQRKQICRQHKSMTNSKTRTIQETDLDSD